MEATILKTPSVTDVGGAVSAELEVKKLQELVRRLERQNEQLRTRANAVGACTSPLSSLQLNLFGNSIGAGSCCVPSPAPTLACQAVLEQCCVSEDHVLCFQPHSTVDLADEAADAYRLSSEPTVLDEVEVLDLDSIFQCTAESDETWLYAGSKSCLWAGSGGTPLQWCRHVLGHPQGELETPRPSLCQRPESVNRWRGVFSSAPPPSAFPHSRVGGVSLLCTSSPASRSSLTSAPCTASCDRQAIHVGSSVRHTPFRPQSSLDSELSTELDDDAGSLGYKLQDLTDVQVMARLQEESLRQDYATSSTSSSAVSRRCGSSSFQFRQPHLEDDDDDDDEDYGQLPPPQPRLTRAGPLGLPHSHTFTSIRDWRRSTPSSTCTLPYHTQAGPSCTPEQLSLRSSSDNLRRSMPNLVRAPSMPSVPNPANHTASPTSIRNSQSFDSSSGLARLQSSGQLQNRVHSVGNFPLSSQQSLKATAYVSPTIKGPSSTTLSASQQSLPSSGIPQPSKGTRSGLPRPASFTGMSSTPRSKLTQPVRSLLTPPKSLATLSALRDGSWRDGCY
ncbi:SLAIN motif-containing protein 1-like isoform X2 [Electrophorus electricus]|uniref:SLAIN motif-containing protein 1-like isoform X2 n=1 Tax=Electrophorus electricus TaxID=8005 RepID=UPI0015D03763|nr:SLAIN motif-containing protein 1-like isoform X2 [Electrophorus electricus]